LFVVTIFFTDKKESEIFLIYKEIQIGSVAKSYMRTGFIIHEEMRKYLIIYEEAVSHILNFLIYEENFVFFFINVGRSFFVGLSLSTSYVCNRQCRAIDKFVVAVGEPLLASSL
jgi:hypothetical protein